MNTIITIGRQCGSGGREIGRTLAERLDIPFYDKERLREEAVESGFESILDAYGEKHAASLLLSLATGAYSFGYHDASHQNAISQKAYLLAFAMVRKAARQGPCVIVGRCADYVLEHHPDCLNVFIHAPLDMRVKAVAARTGTSPEEAAATVRETDRLRQNYYNYYTNKRWGEVDSYHLCVDSGVLGAKGTAAMLEQILLRRGDRDQNVFHLEGRVASI